MFVETVKFADVAPAGTITDTGTETLPGTPDVRFTVHPPVAAGDAIVTVPVAVVPAVTDVGLTEIPVNELPLTPIVVLTVEVASVARIKQLRVFDVGTVVTLNAPVVEPSGITIVAGVMTKLGTPVVKLTDQPPAGAGALRLTDPAAVEPAETVVGSTEMPVRESPKTDRFVLFHTTLS